MIRGIRDLTDARYYAAMGIDWLSMAISADPKSFSTWHAIREWVEGPQFAAELPDSDEALFAKTIIDLKPDGLVLREMQNFPAVGSVQLFAEAHAPDHLQLDLKTIPIVHVVEQQLHVIAKQVHHTETLLESNWTPKLIELVLEHGYQGGFCFNTTASAQIGVKDYSNMDEMLEMLKTG